MSERETTDLGGPNRAAIGRTPSMSAATTASAFVAAALAAIDMASALCLSRSIQGECH